MNTEYVPQLLRTADLGLFLSVQVGRKWSRVITHDAREVAVKRVRNEVVAAAKVVDYPKGLVVAAEHFLKPELGIAVVTPQAKLILEEIMKVYSTKAAAKKGLVRMGGDASQLDALVEQIGDEWHLDDSKLTAPVRADARSKTPSKEQAAAVTKHFDERPKAMRKSPPGTGAKDTPVTARVKRPIVIKDEGAKPAKEPKQGACWQVHQFCDKHHKALESGKMTRGAAVTQIVESGIANGTVQVQIGVWAKKNAVTLTKASRAAE